ncbi:hypothetical protein L1887_20613 [Cichorium endivia]|nr:hypothetical protein L1887_20613 [Cichorium endivia]
MRILLCRSLILDLTMFILEARKHVGLHGPCLVNGRGYKGSSSCVNACLRRGKKSVLKKPCTARHPTSYKMINFKKPFMYVLK